MTENQMQEQINEHRYEIDALKDSVSKTLSSMNGLTDAINKQSTQFAVFAEKHDTVTKEIDSIKPDIKQHGEDIAAMKPTVESLRGLVWKVIFASLAGGTGIGAIIIAMISNVSKT